MPGAAARRGLVSEALARDRLGAPAVVFFVMAAAAPLTTVAAAIPSAFAVTGILGLPIAFAAVGCLLVLFSAGYVAMARHITNAGAFYAYVARGLGRPAGLAASLVALVAYAAFVAAAYGGVGAAAEGLVTARFGSSPPWWVYAGAAWLVVAVLGMLRVELSGVVLGVLLVAETAVVVVFDAVDVAHPAGGRLSTAALAPAQLAGAGVGALCVVAVTAFTGFEATAVFAEETKDPRRTVARATYATVGLIAVLYGASAWAMTVATGPERVGGFARAHGGDAVFVLAGAHLPGVFVDLGRFLFVTSVFAALLSFSHFVARYLFALGREGALPRVLGRTGARSGAPVTASWTVSGFGALIITGYAISHADPLVQLFYYGGSLGGFGVLLLLTATSFAVIGYFTRQNPPAERLWVRMVAPGLAGILLSAVVVLAVGNFDTLLGVAPGDPLRWVLPAVYPAAAALGLGWFAWLRAYRPDAAARIGLGANAITGRATTTAGRARAGAGR